MLTLIFVEDFANDWYEYFIVDSLAIAYVSSSLELRYSKTVTGLILVHIVNGLRTFF
jgi:hypothetical protein